MNSRRGNTLAQKPIVIFSSYSVRPSK
jgi:hypothetical protein